MTVRFHIFEAPHGSVGYGGIDRTAPPWDPKLSDAYNEAITEIADQEGGFVRVEDAQRVAAILRSDGVAVEVVGIERVTSPRTGPLLGYDVTSFSHHSLLVMPGVFGARVGNDPWSQVLRYVEQTVESRLNERRLFTTWDDALQVVTVVSAVQQLKPAWFEEGDGFVLEVHAVLRVG
jgi:hypothetical protein